VGGSTDRHPLLEPPAERNSKNGAGVCLSAGIEMIFIIPGEDDHDACRHDDQPQSQNNNNYNSIIIIIIIIIIINAAA
jgi:hypothetical protein